MLAGPGMYHPRYHLRTKLVASLSLNLRRAQPTRCDPFPASTCRRFPCVPTGKRCDITLPGFSQVCRRGEVRAGTGYRADPVDDSRLLSLPADVGRSTI